MLMFVFVRRLFFIRLRLLCSLLCLLGKHVKDLSSVVISAVHADHVRECLRFAVFAKRKRLFLQGVVGPALIALAFGMAHANDHRAYCIKGYDDWQELSMVRVFQMNCDERRIVHILVLP